MNRLIVLLAALAGLWVSPFAFAGSCEPVSADEALSAEQMRHAAQTSNDFDTMEKIFSPDLVYVHSSSVVDTKQSYIDSMRSGAVVYKVMTQTNVEVRTFGCIAILTGNGKYDVRVNGKDLTVPQRLEKVRWCPAIRVLAVHTDSLKLDVWLAKTGMVRCACGCA
jgi:hypothetical protein